MDHLVYAVPHLERGIAAVEERLRTRLTPGGSHAGLGTKNALLRIGPAAYLEVVGPDPDQPPRPGPLWLSGSRPLPAMSTWAARSSDLQGLANGDHGALIGPSKSMSRKKPDGTELSWSLTFPLSPLPHEGLVPFFIDWGDTQHPAESLPDEGVVLTGLDATHPDPQELAPILDALGAGIPTRPGAHRLTATFRLADGDSVTLS